MNRWAFALATVAVLSLTGACALAAGLPSPEEAGDDLLAELIEGAREREARIQTLGALCTYDTFLSPNTREAWSSMPTQRQALGSRAFDVLRFLWSGNRWRLEVAKLFSYGQNDWCFLGPVPEGKLADDDGSCPYRAMAISDGERVIEADFFRGLAEGRMHTGGGPHPGGGHISKILRMLFLIVNRRIPSQYLEGLENPVVEALEEVNGIECYRVVDYKPRENGGGYMSAVWIAPEKGYAVLKFESLFIHASSQSGQRYLQTGQNLEEVEPGLWLPTKTTHITYNYHLGGYNGWGWTHIVKVLSWAVNPSAEEMLWQLDLPLGTTLIEYENVRETEGEEGTIVTGHRREHTVGDTKRLLEEFDYDAAPPPTDSARERPLKSLDIMENAWP